MVDRMPTDTFFNLPADKRARIVEAALDEFAEFSYDTASISRLVARAGIAKGSFYQYFESKLDLFEWLTFHELGRRKVEFIQARMAQAEPTDFFAMLESMCLAGCRWALEEPRLARIAEALWWPSADPELRQLTDRGRKVGHLAMAGLLRRGQEAGQVRPDLDVELGSVVLTATLQQGCDRVLRERTGLDLVGLMRQPERARAVTDEQLLEVVKAVMDFVRRGIGCPGGRWSPEDLDLQEITNESMRGIE
jgi:AcrR family transcriptional regulator